MVSVLFKQGKKRNAFIDTITGACAVRVSLQLLSCLRAGCAGADHLDEIPQPANVSSIAIDLKNGTSINFSTRKFSNPCSAVLPSEKHYYHYKGSLTTPPCTEGIDWLVLEQVCAAFARPEAKKSRSANRCWRRGTARSI